jgi:hypothetical protein
MIQVTIRRHDLFPHPKSLLMHKCKHKHYLDAPGIVDFGFAWNFGTSGWDIGGSKKMNSVSCYLMDGRYYLVIKPISHMAKRNR